MATESKSIVVDVEEKPLAPGESSGQREEEAAENRGGFFYTYCGGNPVTALISPILLVAAILVAGFGFAAYVRFINLLIKILGVSL